MRNPCFSSGPALRLAPLAAALALFPAWGLAQGIATESQLQTISVTETRSQLDPNLPNSTASKTAQELEAQNIFNPEDAASLLPSTTVLTSFSVAGVGPEHAVTRHRETESQYP